MNFETDAGIFWTRAHADPNKVSLCSLSKDTLMTILASIELAGVEADADFDDLYIGPPTGEDEPYTLDIDRVTLILWFEFETLNYLHVGGEYIV